MTTVKYYNEDGSSIVAWCTRCSKYVGCLWSSHTVSFCSQFKFGELKVPDNQIRLF